MPICKFMNAVVNRCYFGDSCKCKEGDQEAHSAGFHDQEDYYSDYSKEYPRVLEFPSFSSFGG